MKKLLALTIALALLASCPAALAAVSLPAMDLALQMMDMTQEDRIEISPASVAAFDPNNLGDPDLDSLKMIILQREPAKKEFTRLDSGYPDSYVENFPEGFRGVDIGEPRVWLRCDLMRSLPAAYRATSLADAGIILIGESEHWWASTIVHTEYSGGSPDDIPSWVDTPQELSDYIDAHRPVVTAIWYYPMFARITEVDLYDARSTFCLPVDYTYTERTDLTSNPGAARLWAYMELLNSLEQLLQGEQTPETDAEALGLLDQIASYSDASVDYWRTCVDVDHYDLAVSSLEQVYWENAQRLSLLDGEPEHQKTLEMIIAERDRALLAKAVGFFNYNGIELSMDAVEQQELYMVSPDNDWLEVALEDTIEIITR